MKKVAVFLLLIMTISCNNRQNCDDNIKIREIETNNIILTLIDSTSENIFPICTSLKKLNIRTDFNVKKKKVIIKLPPKTDLISVNSDVFIETLLQTNYRGKAFFDKNDSLNFVEQNYCLNSKLISDELFKKIKTISLTELKDEKSNFEYIIISNPIFSSDNKKAYIEVDTKSVGCIYGSSYFLEKQGETWKIIQI